jgi:hypothetical protein
MAWYTPLPSSDPPSKTNFPNLYFCSILTFSNQFVRVNVDLGCRAAHSCDKVGNFLYIFGGWNGKKALNDLYVLDLDKLIW